MAHGGGKHAHVWVCVRGRHRDHARSVGMLGSEGGGTMNETAKQGVHDMEYAFIRPNAACVVTSKRRHACRRDGLVV